MEVTDISDDWFCILAIAAGWNHFWFLDFRSKRCLEKRINGFLSFSFLLLMLVLFLVFGYCHDCQYRFNGISKCFSIHGNLLLEITSKCCHFLLLYISEEEPVFLIRLMIFDKDNFFVIFYKVLRKYMEIILSGKYDKK